MGTRRRMRRVWDRAMRALMLVCTGIALVPIANILVLVTARSLPALRWSLLTEVTAGVSGGLANAIAGTLLLVGLSTAVSVPVGVLGGIYLAEYDRGSGLAHAIRFAADVLSGVPSIVLGYFGYVTMVTMLGWQFSALAGGITLAILSVPYVVRSTEIALTRVPDEVRQAALALGDTRIGALRRVVLRPALRGILTGILLAVSISLGETAPLIYTAGWSNYMPSLRLTHAPVAYLTYVVWNFINEPFASANQLAYAAAFLLIVLILLINVVVRTVLRPPAARRS